MQVPGFVTERHLRRALQSQRTRTSDARTIYSFLLLNINPAIGRPGRLCSIGVLPDLHRRESGEDRRHVSRIALVRRFRRPVERRADRSGKARTRLPQSAHICVERRRI
jgi:hypothetical protein